MEKICIIGGGASALMCAAHANKKITIFESQEKVGKKILATGNGRCNLTNLYMNKYSYNQNVEEFLRQFDQTQTIDFFNNIGLEVYADNEGRVYPISNTATSVLEVLKNYVLSKNIKIEEQKRIIDIKNAKNGVFPSL